ncbi:indole-3-acetic acid-induced protein ARG7-like [Triticum dicoccoides]|uniref:indole-3-acetic acid-induced protein ARG7-like n=1 Tax=Triticum dicoccoides TaxID=85692 RepID=UPI000E7AF22C|nr:indole-3-acetic acid-induced protein ARG7-like [Triticum dicoccoides]
MAKCSKIRDIVWLRQTLRRWRSRGAARVAEGGAAPVTVPAGHVAVCVGGASRRFVVRAAHLNHPVFLELLRQAEEEYGFRTGSCGPIALPCDEDRFRDVLRRVSSEERRGRSFGCRAPAASSRDVATRPLLQRAAAEELVW